MIPLAVLTLARAWWRAAVGAAVVAGPVFLMGQCSGAHHERDKAEAAAAIAVQAAMKTDAKAKEQSSAERLADEREVTTLTQELTNAVASVPDETPDAVAVRLGCERLRRAGQDVQRIPACGGSGGGGQARPVR